MNSRQHASQRPHYATIRLHLMWWAKQNTLYHPCSWKRARASERRSAGHRSHHSWNRKYTHYRAAEPAAAPPPLHSWDALLRSHSPPHTRPVLHIYRISLYIYILYVLYNIAKWARSTLLECVRCTYTNALDTHTSLVSIKIHTANITAYAVRVYNSWIHNATVCVVSAWSVCMDGVCTKYANFIVFTTQRPPFCVYCALCLFVRPFFFSSCLCMRAKRVLRIYIYCDENNRMENISLFRYAILRWYIRV